MPLCIDCKNEAKTTIDYTYDSPQMKVGEQCDRCFVTRDIEESESSPDYKHEFEPKETFLGFLERVNPFR
jgi:hypothetical protein